MVTSLLLCLLAVVPAADGVVAEFVPEGVTQKVGGYRPVRAEMDGDGKSITKAPEDLDAAKYGTLEFGDKQYAFILNEPEEGEPTLFVDTNADGDLTNDPAAEWAERNTNGNKMFFGSATVELEPGKLGKISLYRFAV